MSNLPVNNNPVAINENPVAINENLASNKTAAAGELDAREFHIELEKEEKASQVLARVSLLSQGQVKRAMQKGAVWLSVGTHTQRLRRASKLLKPGQTLHFYYNQAVLDQTCPEAKLLVDEGQYSVWYKPYGMLSQGSKWSDHCTINRWAEQHLRPERPAFIVHRLDRAAQGLILLAHSKKAAAALSGMFASRSMQKTYRVVVEPRPELKEDFSLPLAFDEDFCRALYSLNPDWGPGTLACDDACLSIRLAIDDRRACSHARVLEQRGGLSLLEVDIETGRKHQIRKHMAAISCPVQGDRLHGLAEKTSEVNLQLSATRLSFVCPFTHEARCYQLPESLMLSL